MFVPVFGLLANFGCMLFYLVGPFSVAGMSVKEPYIALGASLLWIIRPWSHLPGHYQQIERQTDYSNRQA